MPGTAAKVRLTERQMEVLETIVASKTAAVRLVQRAQIILLAFQKKNNQTISDLVDLNPLQVGVWRKRWKQKWEHLIQVECTETAAGGRSCRTRRIGFTSATRPSIAVG